MPHTKAQLIKLLDLQPHPEGGYFKETYRSEGVVPESGLPNEYSGARNYCTGIYFMLTAGNFSAFHKINQDEMWHFYDGDPIRVHVITPAGDYFNQLVGRDLINGEVPQFVVAGGCWFASEVVEGGAYSFVGCTVAPGFDFADFDLASRKQLIELFPFHQDLIQRLTRE